MGNATNNDKQLFAALYQSVLGATAVSLHIFSYLLVNDDSLLPTSVMLDIFGTDNLNILAVLLPRSSVVFFGHIKQGLQNLHLSPVSLIPISQLIPVSNHSHIGHGPQATNSVH